MTVPVRLRAVLALVAATTLVAGAGAVADAGPGVPTAGDPPSAAAPSPEAAGATRWDLAQSNATATFDDAVVVAERGDTVELTVVLEGTDRATLSLGSEADLNYALDATVRDGDDDGLVVVGVDLAVAGLEADPLSTESTADSATVTHESFVGDPVEPADYPMSLSVGGVETDVATLVVEEPATPPTGTPGDPPGPRPDVDLAVDHVLEGGTADLAVDFDDSDVMTLTVAGGNASYYLQATVRDGDGDDRVPLTFDTATAGGADSPLTARSDADSVSVSRQTDLEGPLPPGEYDLRLRSGPGATDVEVVSARLVVERAAANGTVVTAPGAGLPTDPAVLVLAGMAVGGLGVAAGSRLVAE